MTPDEIRRVLRSWIGVEVLTPGKVETGGWNAWAQSQAGQVRNRATKAISGEDFWRAPCDEDPPPWSGRDSAERPDDEEDDPVDAAETGPQGRSPRPWYKVVVAAMSADRVMPRLDAVFRDSADEDRVSRKSKGDIFAATAILDEHGMLVPDTLSIASFAWGLGRVLADGPSADVARWDGLEDELIETTAARLRPTDARGRPRPLTWRDLLDVSRTLRDELGIPEDLWTVAPCAVRVVRTEPPQGELLSSFHIGDLVRIEREAKSLPAAAAAYLGVAPPRRPWDALNDRASLSALLDPALFPLGRWPGPGLHPLTLLQQGAVNFIARDLAAGGLAAINGPPGTGKTTLLRDIVAQVMVGRAEQLAAIDDPSKQPIGADLMDYAIVVASSNNAAVENVSLELPLRGKALDESMWGDDGLTYFDRTATHVLGLAQDAPAADRAWGLIAAKLGNTKNRSEFFRRFWSDGDWGLDDWLDRVWSPDRKRFEGRRPSKLALSDPPPRKHEALARWREARVRFVAARDRCFALRDALAAVARDRASLTRLESRLPGLHEARDGRAAEREDAARSLTAAHDLHERFEAEEGTERVRLSAVRDLRPGFLHRLLPTGRWRTHQQRVRERLDAMDGAQAALKLVRNDLNTARAAFDEAEAAWGKAEAELAAAEKRREALRRSCDDVAGEIGSAVPAPDLWSRAEEALQTAAPWNEGAFRDARDALFLAAVRLHHAFVVAGVSRIKPHLNAVAKSGKSPATAQDWGAFFLLVPVVSTTFASIARVFPTLGAASIGWLLVDEAGQASPQHAAGAVWRARRAVVIGDPLQIPPVATTPEKTTARIFENQGADPGPWAAPEQSAQTLADRASPVQGRFPAPDGDPARARITGFPLLVHRRCETPMFEIANRIAYADRMIHATAHGASAIRDLLGPSAWVDVDGPSTDKWVAEEGRLVERAIAELVLRLKRLPDLYVISPFRMTAGNMRTVLARRGGALSSVAEQAAKSWIESHVGTVHTFQGKEAESVVLLLGAGRGAKPGSRAWAGSTPNLLNVAATRAKRSLYVIGNHTLWRGEGVFAEIADLLPPVAAERWSDDIGKGAASRMSNGMLGS